MINFENYEGIMKIEVDRTMDSENNLIFTIKVSEPHKAPFSEIDYDTMNFLEKCKESVEQLGFPEKKSVYDAINAIHTVKVNLFNRVKNSLTFAITNSLRTKYQPICQEIYNWIYDLQELPVKKWMEEVDPQRTKYYFDNDPQLKLATVNELTDVFYDDMNDEDCIFEDDRT